MVRGCRVFVLLVACAVPAAADSIANSATGLSAPGTVLDFDEVGIAPGTPVSNQFSAFGVAFTGLFYSTEGDAFPNVDPADQLSNFPATGGFVEPWTIQFLAPVSGAAFNLVGTRVASFTANLGGMMVESFTASTDRFSNNNFYGFENIVFDEIVVQSDGPFAGPYSMDHLQFSAAAVPEPGVLALCAAALSLVAWRRRRTA